MHKLNICKKKCILIEIIYIFKFLNFFYTFGLDLEFLGEPRVWTQYL